MVLDKTLEIPLDCKEIQLVDPKGNQPGIFTRRTDAEAEAPLSLSSDAHKKFIGKVLMLGKIRAEGMEKDFFFFLPLVETIRKTF